VLFLLVLSIAEIFFAAIAPLERVRRRTKNHGYFAPRGAGEEMRGLS
jgi:hypothetical protein